MFGALGVPDPARGLLFGPEGVLTQAAKQDAAACIVVRDLAERLDRS